MRLYALILSPLAALLAAAWGYGIGLPPAAAITAGITVLCALWWVTEAIPIPVTSLLPLALLPLLGILTPDQVAEAYGNPLILLLLGGFLLSTAMSHSHTHEHIALLMINLFGGRQLKHVVFGFMAAAALLSMWISNTATTLMLLPIALAVLQTCNVPQLAIPLLLGICYAASIGGIGTPIGTPPNLIFMRVFEDTTGSQVTFLQWMGWGLPLVALMVPVAAWILTRRLPQNGQFTLPAKKPWTSDQRRIMAVFAVTALLWITRKEPFGGWSAWLDLPNANDASVALLAVVALFIIPSRRGGGLLTWESASKIPWGMLLLFAGGIALAKAFGASGLAEIIAEQLQSVAALPLVLTVLITCLLVTFMTEVTSNTATTSLLMPILAAVAVSAQLDSRLLMVPAAMSASCAFMLPVATAPNAIVFGSGEVPIRSMVRYGIILNLAGAIAVTAVTLLFV